VESLSAYARQFLGQMEKPEVDVIEGLSPTIAIEQKSASKNPRSTVGTITEIYDYLRLLFARVGTAHCHQCGREVGAQTADQMVDRVLALPPGTRFMILAPLVLQRKGEYKDVFAEARAEGFVRVRVDGQIHDLNDEIKLNKKVKHTIEVVVDRLVMPEQQPDAAALESVPITEEWHSFVTRLTDSMETALRIGEGQVLISVVASTSPSAIGSQSAANDGTAAIRDAALPAEWLMSEANTCTHCGISFPELSPQMFSFNAPQGACPICGGLGTCMEVDPTLLVPNPRCRCMRVPYRIGANYRRSVTPGPIARWLRLPITMVLTWTHPGSN
jgi:Excinuclease ABC subunit A